MATVTGKTVKIPIRDVFHLSINIIKNKEIISRAEHVIIKICNKPRKYGGIADFQKSIMLNCRLRHGFEIKKHENPWLEHDYMI